MWKKVFLGGLLSIPLLIVIGGMTIDRWFFVLLDPGVFDATKTPPAPDYTRQTAWASLPSMKDGADVSLPAYPAHTQKKTFADVFYLHPTTWVGGKWNAPFDAPDVIKATHRGATLIQASVFNACCAIYAPRYRQANGKAFIAPNVHSQKAIDVAYTDVSRAFRYFLKHYNKGRPFLIASHSQGSVLAYRLLLEEIWNKPPAKHWIAGYLIGGPVFADTIPACKTPTQTGCLIGWNARGPRYTFNHLEFSKARGDAKGKLLCVNPLSWQTSEEKVSATRNKGAIFFDAKKPTVKPHFANAQCVGGVLKVTKMGAPERDTMSKILDWIMGPDNYHPIEYQLYYLNLRENAELRVKAFLAKKRGAEKTPEKEKLPKKRK